MALLGLSSVPRIAAMASSRAESRAATQEYDLKAAFLFNFAQFVEWPDDAFAGPSTPITIGILGQDPFGGSLDEMVANEFAHSRRLVVRRCRSIADVDSCHILFISQHEAGDLKSILARLNGRRVLTVGESKDFTAQSGMVGFELVQRRLRLRINLSAANAAGLTISSKLLRQAQIVNAAGNHQ